MFCCDEVEKSVPDLASDRKRAALADARKKGVLANFYILIRCANPYAIDDIVLIGGQRTASIFQCGNLVFQMIDNDLKKYTCGDWSEKLADEAKALKAQRAKAKTRDRAQSYKNAAAAKNYVVC
jgi:hypothetical protein